MMAPVSTGRARIYQTVPSPFQRDSLALVALYNSTNGANWTNKTNWLTGPVSTWFGVTVTNERVTSIDLGHNNLSGPIPVEIYSLTELTNLSLRYNNVSGPLTADISNLQNLAILDIHGNPLTGTIPASIGTLSNLGYLGMDLPYETLFPRVEKWVAFTPFCNATGGPSLSLPLGHDPETNLPVGMLFSAALGQEKLLLELAFQLEEAKPWRRIGG